MSLASALRLAVSVLLLHRGRSALTSLGIVIGISAVVALVSAGDGARQKLDDRLESAGKNLIIIRPGGRTGAGVITDFRPLTAEDAEAIRKDVGPLLNGVAPWQVATRPVTSGATSRPTVIVGSTPDYQRVGSWQVEHGRSFNDDDLKKAAPVCLLGQTVLHKLFPNRPNPVGEKVDMGRLRVQVIGVLATKGFTPLGQDQDDQVFMPLTTLQRKLVGKEDVAVLLATARSAEVIDEAQEAITRVLRQRHHLRPGVGNDFDVANTMELAAFALSLTWTLQTLVVFVAAIALAVGGIGIMNIMLVSVMERTKEIGLRMAVGATPANILVQFLIEAVVLALLGGVVGVALGIGGAVGLARVAGWPVVISPAAIVLAFVMTAAVGIFFGYYPALKASRLDPIVALGRE